MRGGDLSLYSQCGLQYKKVYIPDMGRPIWAYTPNMGLKYTHTAIHSITANDFLYNILPEKVCIILSWLEL